MPALVVLGRRSSLSGDDLSIFLFGALLFKLIQLGLLLPLLFALNERLLVPDEPLCRNVNHDTLRRGWVWLVAYWALSAALVLVSLLLSYVMIKVSRRGTPSEPERRAALSRLCAVNLTGVALLRVVVLTFGLLSMVAVANLCACEGQIEGVHDDAALDAAGTVDWRYECRADGAGGTSRVVPMFRGLFVTHAIEASLAVFFYIWRLFDVVKPAARLLGERRRDGCCSWTVFCRACCTCTSLLTCCLFGGLSATLSDFVDVSAALEDFFDSGGTLDVTLSDIIAGLLMVHREQTEERAECHRMFRRLGGHTRSQQLQEATASMEKQEAHQRLSEAGHPAATAAAAVPLEQPWRGHGLTIDVEAGEAADEPLRKERQQVFEAMVLRRHRTSEERVFEPRPRFILDPNFIEDKIAIIEGAHFIKFALAIYGYKLYIANHTLKGTPYLCAKSLFCSAESCRDRLSTGDIACGCYRNAFLAESGLDAADLLYASFCDGIVRRPYCIVVDRTWNAIVVVIRGTLSLEDWVADFTIRPMSLDEGGEKYGYDFKGEFVHSGMMASAEWVYNDIAENGVLEGLFFSQKSTFKHFKLYVTGHSLGAGVASVLSLLLRSKYPRCRCLAFAPPGCTFSEGVARGIDVTSYVYNHDIVPRLSMHSMENLRNDLLLMLARMKVSKEKVILPTPFACQGSSPPTKDILYTPDGIPPSKLLQQLEEFRAYGQSKRSERGKDFHVTLFPPGKIVHVVNSRAELPSRFNFFQSSQEEEDIITAIWADNGDFGEIVLASSFVGDHHPIRLQQQLGKLVDAFAFESK